MKLINLLVVMGFFLSVGPASASPSAGMGGGGGGGCSGQVVQKCITIETAISGESFLLLRVPAEATVTRMDCISVGTASTVITTLQECDANAANCVPIQTNLSCGTTSTVVIAATPFTQNPAVVDAGDWIRVLMGTNTSSTQLAVCVTYTIN